MESENHFFDLIFLGLVPEPVKEPIYEERTFSLDQLGEELAFHEASHFVFELLIAKISSRTEVEHIIACAEKFNLEGFNRVSGGMPKLEKLSARREEGALPLELIEHYKDIRNLALQLLVKIAGYSSFQVFIKNKKYYINPSAELIDPAKHLYKAKYYNQDNSITSDTDDFANINKKLEIYFRDQGKKEDSDIKRIKAIRILTNAAQKLMKMQAVFCSIKMVKKALLKNECQKIEGNELKILKDEVSRQINKIPIGCVLEVIKMQFDKL